MRSKIGQRFVDRNCQCEKFLEVFVVRRPLFRLLPQIFNGIVIRGIRRQRMFGDPIAMRCQKGLSRGARVIPGAIVNQKDVRGRLRQDHLQKRGIRFRRDTLFPQLLVART